MFSINEIKTEADDTFDSTTITSNDNSKNDKIGYMAPVKFEPELIIKDCNSTSLCFCSREIGKHDVNTHKTDILIKDESSHYTKTRITFDSNADGESISHSKDLDTNISAPSNITVVTCDFCPKQFASFHSLKFHLYIHTGKPFKCSQCSKQFTWANTLKQHLRVHCREQLFKCEMCIKEFCYSSSLNRHYLKAHTNITEPFNCKICGDKFRNARLLIRHGAIHKNKRKYICEVCSKTFVHPIHCKYHMQTHTGEKPYQCEYCSKQFSLKGTLQKHMHKHFGQKLYNCDVCDKAFGDHRQLRLHSYTHKTERPFKCSICPKQFIVTGDLKRHMCRHTGEKNFACIICPKKFADRKLLKTHLKRHKETVNESVVRIV